MENTLTGGVGYPQAWHRISDVQLTIYPLVSLRPMNSS
jgi:hypothetical protein